MHPLVQPIAQVARQARGASGRSSGRSEPPRARDGWATGDAYVRTAIHCRETTVVIITTQLMLPPSATTSDACHPYPPVAS